ncbi:MAG: tRNA (adenosine(37)-N6)-threonylcarbamoyltransferase complex ATPase subunit type 1 TsaE [Opitutaceae bacterium]|nr:tRNA (adenosine(37)-N6)-threonylcarbamoyltransferase complex ATPase subunit type 1 TsaE [Cytophagales bacterium]
MEISLQYKLENTREISERILDDLAHVKLILFHGEIGSGKTTLIKEICKGLLIEEEISSPTFSIVNEYQNKRGEIIYHFDLYRLKNIEELEGIGFIEYLNSQNLCLIEWPEIAMDYFNDRKVLIVNLVHNNPDSRKITLSNKIL